MLLYPHLMAKYHLRVGRKSRFFPDLSHETCQQVVVEVGWRDLQSCWECYWPCYIPNQCQTSIIQQPTCCYTPTWWPNLPGCWQKIEIFSWSEAWNPPTWGCRSVMEGLTIMLVVLLTLLYTYTMPNNHYCSTYMMSYPHLMAKHCLTIGRKSRSEAWNLPTSGGRSGMEGLTIMLGVLLTLLYT